jgi:hypothetical protein
MIRNTAALTCSRAISLAFILLLPACEPGPGGAQPAPDSSGAAPEAQPVFHVAGQLKAKQINEASGIQAGAGDVFYLHNDDGTKLFLTDATGRDLGSRDILDSSDRDWEDITRVPGADGPLLVIGDIGDNNAVRSRLSLYFLREPSRDDPPGPLQVTHRLRFRYADGPRDAEAMAYDPASGEILVLTKRDQPPRLYGLPLDLALWQHEMEAEFLGTVPGFRPPTRADILRNPGRGMWVSQPTGMDISPDGRLAAVITYRSLYLFSREGSESWVQAFQRQPTEYVGPPGTHDEAVGFSLDGRSIFVTTEGRPAPLYRMDLL